MKAKLTEVLYLVLAAIALMITTQQVQAGDRTFDYISNVSVEESTIIKKYLDNTEPYIFPAITGVVGGISAGAAVAAAGASAPMIGVAVALNGFTGYFYGYGIESAIDRHIIVPVVVKDKQKKLAEFYNTQKEAAKDQINNLKDYF